MDWHRRAPAGRPVDEKDELEAEAEIFAEYERTNAIADSALEIPAKTIEGLRDQRSCIVVHQIVGTGSKVSYRMNRVLPRASRSIIRDLPAA
jgi:hypothetical protein